MPKVQNVKNSASMLSDDETNVHSDNEDQIANFSILKQDSTSNNFNRPKLKENKEN